MLKFVLKEEYQIDKTTYESGLGFDLKKLHSIFWLNFMAAGDGRLVIHLRANGQCEHQYYKTDLILNLDDSRINVQKLENNFQDDPLGRQCKSFLLKHSILLTHETNRAKLISNYGQGDEIELVVENPLSDYLKSIPQHRCDEYPIDLHPDEFQTAIGEGAILPVPVKGDGRTTYICFLDVDESAKTARWKNNLTATLPSSRKFRLFRKRLKSNLEMNPASFLKIPSSALYSHHRSKLRIEHSMIRNGHLYVFSRGNGNGKYTGYQFTVIAQIGSDGNVISFPFHLDHRVHNDQKKRGHNGAFTSSKKYCILKSIYKSTDEWKGKQRLFDMDSHELITLQLPKGFANYDLIDHYGQDYWFQKRVKSGLHTETKIIRCEVV